MSNNKKAIIRRGDIILVSLGENKIGSIQAGTRPMLVVSNNRANRHSTILLVVPLSTKKLPLDRVLPTHISITNQSLQEGTLLKESTIMCEQLTVIDREMVIRRIGTISEKTDNKLKEALLIALGIINAPESA
ncbi:mRNA interferase MazF [Ureibacillus xyleni]|uniref:mRNA interferase MazF n=1 Tax=Ureibacillus xyleni TaxID=614648 RepID=A0A285RDB1_9BACL|nr:type II toxin-antitoxin system PemK/MazF family toxin [Ureibacillus xyleni]SOB90367.1 mRNA interferase MazF [Ureibacillus xyleni]